MVQTIQNKLLVILPDLFHNGSILVWLLGIVLVLLIFTFSRNGIVAKILPIKNNQQLHAVRLYLGSLILVILTILLYWVIDAHFVDLPDPIFPFTFYILIFTVLFGFR